MVKSEVVAYLQANLKRYPVDALRRQLSAEGISDADFDDSLKRAISGPSGGAPRATPSRASLLFLAAGVAFAAGLAVFMTIKRPRPAPPPAAAASPYAPGESAFVGHTGYVIRLPAGYTAMASFKNQDRQIEIVHFCKAGTDPTNFLHEGLFGQLGIVRLEVQPNPFAGNITGIDRLSRLITANLSARGDKFAPLKNIQVSSLRGIQVQIELPQPSIETFILGEEVLYHFYAGQDDEICRDIINSLRDPHAETL